MSDSEKDKSIEKAEKSLETSVFGTDNALSFIHKKVEKISSAVYLVTNHLSDSEPLKTEIRTSCIAFLKDITYLPEKSLSNSFVSESLRTSILSISSLLNVLKDVGFISTMNHKVILEELLNLQAYSDDDRKSFEHDLKQISRTFFDVPEPTFELNPDLSTISRNENLENNDGNFNLKDISIGQSKGHPPKGHIAFGTLTDRVMKNSNQGLSGSARKQKMIDFIRRNSDVGIKDMARLIKDCSEKTLQRDLVSLVKAGVLKKKGQRRWSRYYIA